MDVEPKVAALLDAAMREGWDFFDKPPRGEGEKPDKDPRVARLALIAGALWGAPEFRELVEWMCDASLRRVTFVTQLGVPMDQAALYGAFREGQNAMVFALLKLIAQGLDQPSAQSREPT